MADTGRYRRTVLRVILASEVVVALVTGATVVFAYNHINGKIDPGDPIVHHAEPPPAATPTSPLNILVMGSDGRDCVGCKIDREAGAAGSDVTMLIHVADGRKSAYGISIPRDTLVDRPECTKDGKTIPAEDDVMWNEAFAVGGPACTVAQLEAVTGIWVDNYITIDFRGFVDMVDAVGGVEVCIPEPIDDDFADIHFDAGTQTLDGQRSLDYVRERHSTPNADLGRVKRQQAFVASMLQSVMAADTLTRPDQLLSFASALADSIETNPEIASVGKLVDLASSLRDANLAHIKFVTAPVVDFPQDSPHRGRLQLTDEAAVLWEKVKGDRPLGRLSRDAISGRAAAGATTGATAAATASASADATASTAADVTTGADVDADANGLCD